MIGQLGEHPLHEHNCDNKRCDATDEPKQRRQQTEPHALSIARSPAVGLVEAQLPT